MRWSRLLPEHFREDGRPKESYETKEEALYAAEVRGGRAYPCSFCGKWHRASK